MLSLIAKDFKLLFQGNYTNKLGKLLSIVFTIVIGVLLIVIETYVFRAIFVKIKDVKDASLAYFSVFLFIVSTLLTVFAIVICKRLFFNKNDSVKLQSLPISNFKLVVSKLFFLFITMYFVNLVFNLPLFITYGAINNVLFFFYFKAIFYPLLLFFFQAGVALLLVYPYKLLSDILDKYIIAKIIVYLVIAFVLTILYSQVLDIFINIVVNNNVNSLFTVEAMNTTKTLAKYMIPVNFLLEGFVSNDVAMLFLAIGISLAIFFIGVVVTSVLHRRFLQNVVYKKEKPNAKEIEVKSIGPTKALIKKEFILLFRNSSFLISFITLLMAEPLISYLVIRSLNAVFLKGSISYYLIAFPNIIPNFDILMMMLISVIIYHGVNNYISSENKSLRLMKSIPVSPFTQLSIKVVIPLSLSSAFIIISYLVLGFTKTLAWVALLYGLLLTLTLLISVSFVSLYEELSLKRNQEKNALLSNAYTYGIPLLFLGTAILFGYLGMNSHLIYATEFVLILLSFVPFVIHFNKRITDKFYDLEVIN